MQHCAGQTQPHVIAAGAFWPQQQASPFATDHIRRQLRLGPGPVGRRRRQSGAALAAASASERGGVSTSSIYIGPVLQGGYSRVTWQRRVLGRQIFMPPYVGRCRIAATGLLRRSAPEAAPCTTCNGLQVLRFEGPGSILLSIMSAVIIGRLGHDLHHGGREVDDHHEAADSAPGHPLLSRGGTVLEAAGKIDMTLGYEPQHDSGKHAMSLTILADH